MPKGLLSRSLQVELLRVGCGAFEATEVWGRGARGGLRQFNKYAKADFDSDAPTAAGDVPLGAEVEPNDTLASAQKLAMDAFQMPSW